MVTEAVKSEGNPSRRMDDFLTPAAVETLFWRPRFMADSALMQHVPFLFWLAGAIRPRAAAVCGAGDGVAQFALCQAMDKLNIAGRCLGIGFWTDPDTGAPMAGAPRALREHATQLYDDIARWECRASGREALAAIAPGSLDLLVVDIDGLPASDRPSAGEWLEVLRPDGIVVLHGPLPRGADADAGLAELVAGRPAIHFPDERGLTVLPPASEPPHRVQGLLRACDRGVLPGETGLLFRRLGQGHLAVARNAAAEAEAGMLRADLAAARQAHEEAQAAMKDLREAHEARSRKLSTLQEELFEREGRLAGLIEEMKAAERDHTGTLAEAQAGRQAAEEQITTLKWKLETAGQELAAAKAAAETERRTRFDETAALTRRLEALHGMQGETERLKARNKAQSRRIEELLDSTSWRITAPMRKVKTALTRR